MSDLDQLVERCQQGDLCAFTTLFHAYQTRVYRLAVTILRDERDAEDAVQDVFVRLFERIHAYRGEAAFTTWLTAIVVNHCRDRLRRRKVRQALSLGRLCRQASEEDLSEVVAWRQQWQTLWALVDRLDEQYRLPVILHYHEGLSCGEVAQVLDLPVGRVYSRLNAARVQLRAMLQEQRNQPGFPRPAGASQGGGNLAGLNQGLVD
jgi:RNA polymerase sigma-70 factor (ECF subfamily)